MGLLETLVDCVSQLDHPVRGVWSCAFWTLATTRHSGLASTVRGDDAQHSDHADITVPDAGRLLEKSARELARYVFLSDPVAASIGLATINSLLDVDETRCVEQHALDILLEKARGRTVGIVGHFGFVPRVREVAEEVYVLEQRPRPGDLPASSAPEILPACDVICLTATTLINRTIDSLLEFARGRFIMLVGPSAPLTPVLFDFGISAICGARVTDADEVLRYISQGACFKQVRGHGVRLLTMLKP